MDSAAGMRIFCLQFDRTASNAHNCLMRCLGVFVLLLVGCAPAPGEAMRSRFDASIFEDSATDRDAGGPDADASRPDAPVNCDCDMAGMEETQLRSSTCGDYDEKRVCNGCMWGAWQGEPPDCMCEPGSTGDTREVEGGTGCAAGKRMEQEVCDEDGSGYTWTATTAFDGSAKECTANATEKRTAEGMCSTYEQTRKCSSSCVWGSWQGSEGTCYPDNKYVGDPCGNGGSCQCRNAGADTCSPQYTCADGFRWRTGLCGGVGTVCCEPDCSSMDATGSGDVACPLGYKWSGSDCVLVRGCGGCTGADCANLMTFDQCQALKQAC